MIVDIYLRKSRSDEELEKTLGNGETLARHRKALLRYAKENGFTILHIHEELVSGEELFFRPAMLATLKDVESGACDGVLVMDIQRLGRGDMEEQGLILKAFKKSNTKIITPKKIYDLNDEFDEEYSEFEAFMSRKEYKMINRRMQRGRINSVEEGNYIATRPPYGYDILRIDKNTRTLKPNAEQAEVVKMIFNWYVNENMGCSIIANELNQLGIKSYTGAKWQKSTIINFFKNPIYIGKVVWKKKCIRKSKESGKKRDTYTRPVGEWIVCNGKHEAIIEESIYQKAQEILAQKYHVPYQIKNGITNPLAGIVICGICGSKMIQRPVVNKAPRIMCPKNCGQKSNKFITVEALLISKLENYYSSMLLSAKETPHKSDSTKSLLIEKNVIRLENELKTLEQQKVKTFDLLEQGVYDTDTFTERTNYILEKINQINSSILESKKQLKEIDLASTTNQDYIIKLRSVLDAYKKINSPSDKNLLIKLVLDKVVYNKAHDAKADDFKIALHPKIQCPPFHEPTQNLETY